MLREECSVSRFLMSARFSRALSLLRLSTSACPLPTIHRAQPDLSGSRCLRAQYFSSDACLSTDLDGASRQFYCLLGVPSSAETTVALPANLTLFLRSLSPLMPPPLPGLELSMLGEDVFGLSLLGPR